MKKVVPDREENEIEFSEISGKGFYGVKYDGKIVWVYSTQDASRTFVSVLNKMDARFVKLKNEERVIEHINLHVGSFYSEISECETEQELIDWIAEI